MCLHSKSTPIEKPDMSKSVLQVTTRTDPLIEIKNLTKIYGDKETQHIAINNLCLEMYRGEVFGLLGHNGKLFFLCYCAP